ncbi:6-phosphogluconate phosphatase [Aquimixticola soesokkakensis]|uniref:6-phosphogluconate phosphatase n=1 Tax=Aquimixticola soesokkakensis TaxID=1519096 RepID=A0A1Y5RGF9_9RHOB|nr:HAD-IA family hydrolase [Aquimixticola soesokkakensis]SLN16650.1 6-phosphogluconate phosphatase [Aquimixticola soesokkakensis]
MTLSTSLPSLVIFDCDGVIVDSEPVLLGFLRGELAERGLDLTMHELENDYVGGTIYTLADKARAAGADLDGDWPSRTYEKVFAHLRGTDVPLVRGIVAALDALDGAGIAYAVASNGPMPKMEITLKQKHPAVFARLEGRIFSAHDVGYAKPDPRLVLAAAEQAGVAPEACLFVDDSPTGATAGVRAGMRTLGYAERTDAARLAAVGAEPFHDMYKLASLIGL